MNSRTVFLDRDGVLIEDHGYVHKIEDMKLLDGVVEGIQLLKSKGLRLVVASNQSGVARGMFAEKDIHVFHEELNKRLNHQIDAFYYCPHHPQGSVEEYTKVCECRKPATLMFETDKKLAPFTQAIMVGDKDSDMEFAKNAGIPGVFIETRYGTSEIADFDAKDFSQAVEIILNHFSLT